MNNVARVFDHHSEFYREPPPEDHATPWAINEQGALPPPMFQLRFQDRRMVSFAYSDLREVHCQHAGKIELYLYSLNKLVITIEGRHLRELAQWFSAAGVRWVQETDPRSDAQQEASPQVLSIVVEQLPD